MWKLILLCGIIWWLWRRWTRFLRETIARIKMSPTPPYNTPPPHSQTNSANTSEHVDTRRVVRCERCGIYVPLNEVQKLPGSPSQSPLYTCITPCDNSAPS